MSLEVKPVSNFLVYLAQNCIKRSLTHPNDFRNSFFGTFPYIVKNILRYISEQRLVIEPIDDTTTTKFTNRACAVHCNSLPVVVVVLKFPNIFRITTI